jgi:hypothetical protein
MRRLVLTLAAVAVTVSTTACGGGDVTVQAQIAGQATATEETDSVALGSLPVRLLPFDRDAIFDSLSQAFPEPEPEIPDSIIDLQDRVIASQQEWKEAESRWIEQRDRLQAISDTLATMDQTSGEYFALFQEFGDIEEEVDQLERQSEAAFEEFEELQRRLTTQSREIELERQNWADEAFANVDSIFDARQEELGLEVRYDTTNAQGVARFIGVPSGEWWVNARYDRPFDELYWNVPVQVEEDLVMRLTEENAEVRQKM